MVCLMDDFDARIFFGVLIGDFVRIVGGAIVDKENFEILMSLSEDGIKTGRKILCYIVDWDNDGYFVGREIIHTVIIACTDTVVGMI